MVKVAFIFGLLGSLHCLGMCGPIAFVLPLNRQNQFKKGLQLLLYHLGRLISYASIGVFFGALGNQISLFGFQQYLSIFTGILMIAFVIFPKINLGWLPQFKWAQTILIKLQNRLKALLLKKEKRNFLAIGLLNGLLPCGFVYMAIFGSLTYSQSLLDGLLFMLFFGLGTLPIMTSVVYSFKLFSKRTQLNIQKQYHILVIIIAGLFILRGMGLDIPYLSPEPIELISNQMNCR